MDRSDVKLGVYTANIEHEDVAFGPLEGLAVAAETLKAANAQAENT